MHSLSLFYIFMVNGLLVSSKDIWITVGHNTTVNANTVFQPASVRANQGDTVWFNFTLGNHTATQSTFAAPCIRAHDTNITINGFDSSFRDAGNETAITTLPVQIQDEEPIWFYDFNTCAGGGVGVINSNDSSGETLEGFRRNAIRLNGTAIHATSSSLFPSASTAAATPTSSQSTSSAQRLVTFGAAAVVPFLIIALSL